MTRLTKNPEAMAMMLGAAEDPELMGAMQTAIMGGSPADLLHLGERNPKVADFLKRLWSHQLYSGRGITFNPKRQ